MTRSLQPHAHRDRERPVVHHRAAGNAGARPAGGKGDMKGGAPHGMWAVAWRQHRVQIAVTLGLIALIAIAIVVYRFELIARFAASNCSLTDMQTPCQGPEDIQRWDNSRMLWHSTIFPGWWRLLQMGVMIAPVVLGAFVGAPLFPREFEQRTHVFALTQAVGRTRWWAAKVTVAGVPLLAGLIALGLLMQWAASTTVITNTGLLGQGEFQTLSIMPAAFGLLSAAIAVAAGVLTRRTVVALVAGLVVAAIAVIGVGVILYPHALPASRQVTSIAALYTPEPGAGSIHDETLEPNALFISSGYLDAAGRVTDFNWQQCTSPDWDNTKSDQQNSDAQSSAMLACYQSQGIVSQYQDYLPGRMLWPLRWAVTGICAALAALFLTLSAWRLRWAVSKR